MTRGSTLSGEPTNIPSPQANPSLRPLTTGVIGVGRHAIYRGLTKSSMEYMSLRQCYQARAAYQLNGEILISDARSPGYVQYSISLDHEWRTRQVKIASQFGDEEESLYLEVDQDQRWFKVTDQRLSQTRGSYCQGKRTVDKAGIASHEHTSQHGHSRVQEAEMRDADSEECSYSSSTSSASSSDSECTAPLQRLGPVPALCSKRKVQFYGPWQSTIAASCSKDPIHEAAAHAHSSRDTVRLASKTTTTRMSSKIYEHMPYLDGCLHLDLGSAVSPSTFLLPLRRAAACGTLPEKRTGSPALKNIQETVQQTVVVCFPSLELMATQVTVAYVGCGRRGNLSMIEYRQGIEDSVLVEADEDGLPVRFGREWARIPFA